MNNDNFIEAKLISLTNNVEYYEGILVESKNPYEKMYYEHLLNCEKSQLQYFQSLTLGKAKMLSVDQMKQECITGQMEIDTPRVDIQENPSGQSSPGERVFTKEELAQYDGSGGKPAYVAIQGIVYDVGMEPTWGGGTHFSLYAGKDLTDFYLGCHQGNLTAVGKLPIVGRIG